MATALREIAGGARPPPSDSIGRSIWSELEEAQGTARHISGNLTSLQLIGLWPISPPLTRPRIGETEAECCRNEGASIQEEPGSHTGKVMKEGGRSGNSPMVNCCMLATGV
jgi:hypothetical protein